MGSIEIWSPDEKYFVYQGITIQTILVRVYSLCAYK